MSVSQLFHGPTPRSPLRLSIRLPSALPVKRHRGELGHTHADATTISLAAPAMSFKLTMGMSPF